MSRSAFTLLLAFVVLLGFTAFAAPPQQANLKSPATLNAQAPPVYKARFDTSAGIFVVEVHRDWAPHGADRFYNLVKNGFYDGCRFFRVVPGFMVQWGMNGDPAIQRVWTTANLTDDPVKQSNLRGYVTFAQAGVPNTRSTQVFVNFRDNTTLDHYPPQGFAPFGKVVSGMDVVDKLYGGYGDGPPQGTGPDQGLLRSQGNAYLEKQFPKLDYIKKATIEQ